MTDNQRELLYRLTDEIDIQARECASEQQAPQYDADKSDDFIKERKESVAKFRSMRETLENIFTGLL